MWDSRKLPCIRQYRDLHPQVQFFLWLLMNISKKLPHAHIHNRKFYLSVENTGNPIPEEIRDRLFERFFRADEARADNGHFGLGLSIAHSIVTNHSGKITVERQGDKNVFSVMLPVTFHK